jgi:4-hydroxy-3-methylbut-2-enyl diphosphate reductase
LCASIFNAPTAARAFVDAWLASDTRIAGVLHSLQQTTLSVDDAAEIMAAVQKRFPQIRPPKQQDICYATQNRQDAVKLLSPQVDIVIVVGSPSSSNSNRLRDVSQKYGTPSYMVDHADELQAAWFEGKQRIGLTAGASAPDILVQQVITRLRTLGAVSVRTLDGIQETIKFPLPKGLKVDLLENPEPGSLQSPHA